LSRLKLAVSCSLTLSLLVGFSIAGAAAAAVEGPPKTPPSRTDFFEKRIRPALAANCWKCHGPKKQEAGLRLDSRRAVLKGSENGPVVVSGKPRASRLIAALQRTGDVKMPPDRKLPKQTIADFSTWIRLGLPWPASAASGTAHDRDESLLKSHWAFRPIRRPPVPSVRNREWPRTPIDRFILAKLEATGLSPSRRADRRTLLRRTTFDLTGLPPTPDELAAFQNDRSPNAFAKVVDRLLASPRYGERWGRFWLDVARYADNKGYVFFEEKKFPWAYTYRDYVVRAFNGDKPFDRFVLEQLAADKLDLGADKSALTAMGFLTLGGRFMNNTHDVLDDRIDVVARGLMGVTVTCARCHDHKFDPVSQAEYYALYGIFRSSAEPTLQPLFRRPPHTPQYAKFAAEMRKRLKALEDFVASKHRALVADGRKRAAGYLAAAYAQRNQPPTDDFMLLIPAGELHPSMIHRWQLYLENAKRTHDPVWTIWHRYADIPDGQFAARVNAVTQRLQSLDPSKTPANRLVLAAFRNRPPRTMKDVAARYAEVLHAVEAEWKSRPVVARKPGGRGNGRNGFADPDKEQLRQVFYGPDAPPNVPRTMGYGSLSLLPDRESQAVFQKLIKKVEQWSMTGPAAPPRAMVLVDTGRPYQPRIFRRGNPSRPGRYVPRALPRFLGLADAANVGSEAGSFRHVGRRIALPPDGSGRLTLAKAIVDSRNPLTARVIVNRIWQQHFGAGLVTTPSDFGTRSAPPSHPELLDWLATELVRGGWSIKRLHRLILLSAVYRQSSVGRLSKPSVAAAHSSIDGLESRPTGRKPRSIDPENRLLWRMNRRRLDFEAMRDSLLVVAGQLDQQLGGPPVSLLGNNFQTRRTIYGFVDRMNLPGLYRAFDFPSPAATSPNRETTTIPPQALYLMNHQFVRQAAERLVRRPDVATCKSTDGRLERLFSILFNRKPSPAERRLAREFLGMKPSLENWTRFAHGLLMTNEFVFVD
jgi:Protein of unknown function (DUF1553)/Protein of unknown function (DUF1549)/Planctomycete cytochrome C